MTSRLWDLVFDRIDAPTQNRLISLGLLLVRVVAGAFMIGHGYAKLARFGELTTRFADPIGVGPAASLVLAIFAEFFCALAIMAGLFTRAAAVPLLVTMLVAALVIHGPDPWAKKELPLLYAAVWSALLFTGAGRYSLDRLLFRQGG